DHFSDRWIFVADAEPQSASSALVIGYSQTSDPTGNWTLFDILADPQAQFWADYPLVGFNEKWLVVTANEFDLVSGSFTGAQIYVLNRTNLVAGTQFFVPPANINFPDLTYAPAVTFDPNQANLYLVSDHDNHTLNIASISGSVTNPVFNPQVSQVTVSDKWDTEEQGENFLPQLGSSTKIDANDSRMLDCVFRQGTLWCVHHVYLPAGGNPNRTSVYFWQVNTNGTIVQRDAVDDPTGVNYFAYPSLAVNTNGDVLVGYSRFSANQFAGSDYSFRFSYDPPGVMSGNDTVLKDGEASYSKDFGSGRFRWGDYSSTCVDPVNGVDMWTLQEYAASPDDVGDRWGTWWGQLFFGGTPTGILQVNVNPPTGSTLLAGTTNAIIVRVTDALPVTNATVVASINRSSTLVFTNNAPPVQVTNSAFYGAYLVAPTNASSIDMVLNISAPGKTNDTTEVTYTIVPPPPNDNFTNAIKVPAAGAVYLSNNKFATTEPREPIHGSISTEGASLWWKWSPDTDTNVLVDTAGSTFSTVVAVYTGSTLSTLTSVASAAQTGTNPKGYLTFNAQAGVTYRIAIASVATNSTGTLHLRVAPGGQPDTVSPVVAFTTPPNGSVVSSNHVTLLGSAFDPQPNASGVKQVFVQVNNLEPRLAFGTNVWTNTVTLLRGFNTISASAVDEAGNQSTPVTMTLTYQVLDPINDFFVNATDLKGFGGIVTGNNTNATKEAGEPNHAGNVGGKSVWWRYYAPSDGLLFLSTTNSSFDTLLAVYTGNRVSNLTAVASNDDAFPGSGWSKIAQAVQGGQIYDIAVDGYGGAFGSISLTWSFTPQTVFSLTVSNTAGGSVAPASGLHVLNEPVTLQATPNPNYDFDHWDGSYVSMNNPLSIVMTTNVTLVAHFRPHVFSDNFQSGTLTNLPWVTTGNAPWFVQTNVVFSGTYAARSGVITNSQSSSLILTGNFYNATASFVYKVSSEPFWDIFTFSIDGTVQQQWSGEIDWTSYQFTMPAGTHVLNWTYAKDPTFSEGLDAAFLANVDLPLVQATNSLTAATLSFLGFLQGQPQLQLHGQTNQIYVIQVSSNLADWSPVATNTATEGVIIYTDPAPIQAPARYYRAVSP
ncbi:MAG: hypothetical protein KGS61_15565, partial [Verrucomicrobia bacterium]|nr:hypothetical protein [Verrucomicrobiota bacterium]